MALHLILKCPRCDARYEHDNSKGGARMWWCPDCHVKLQVVKDKDEYSQSEAFRRQSQNS